MSSRPEGVDPQGISGLRAREILEVVDTEGTVEALQIILMDNSSVVFVVWTDWSLIVDKRSSREIPDYLWPKEGYTRRPFGFDIPEEGLGILFTASMVDEFGAFVGADIAVDGHLVSVRSVGGQLALCIR
ncbi:hypothetical protein [Kitasatospora purpeofusca]|uniref:hypothetical protein n=1 Tax=Kitasatospora purpeofusca TaxID=67352 RepID=UPI003F4AA93C